MTVRQQVLKIITFDPGLTVEQMRKLIVGKSEWRPKVNTACLELIDKGAVHRVKGADGVYHYYLGSPETASVEGKSLLHGQLWQPEEILPVVVAYWDMLQLELEGKPYSKRQVIQKLLSTSLPNRSRGAVERRMQNISSVLVSLERPFIQGFKPLDHVGAGPSAQILKLLAELDDSLPDVLRPLPAAEKLPPAGCEKPERVERSAVVFKRDPAVVAWVLRRSKGFCEKCGNPAPFVCADDSPYLEVHHVQPLSAGGPDTPLNAVALCPNCHCEAHYSAGAEAFTQELKGYLAGLAGA